MTTEDLKYNGFLVGFAIVATIFLLTIGSYIQEGFEIDIGDISPRLFTAPRQVENRIATERLRDEARAMQGVVFMHDSSVDQRVSENIAGFFDMLADIRVMYNAYNNPAPIIVNELEPSTGDEEYEEEIVETVPFFEQDEVRDIISRGSLLGQLSLEDLQSIIDFTPTEFAQFERAVANVSSSLLEAGVTEEVSSTWQQDIENQFVANASLGFIIVDNYIMPNSFIDTETMERLKEERAAEVVPEGFLQNQNIINEGEIITEEIYYVLLDLGYINTGHTINFIPIVGASVIVLIVFGIVSMYIYLFYPKLYTNKKHVTLLFTLYMMVIIATWAVGAQIFVAVPVLIITMLVGMLLDHKLAIIINFGVTIVTFLIFDGDLSFILYFLLTGTVAAIATKFSLERSQLIIFSVAISIINAVMFLSLGLLVNRVLFDIDIFMLSMYAAAAGFLYVIICMGTLPLWESIFGVITPIKLLDLTNPSNDLLRRLSTEAPGTYHHSIVVANLAEAAAHDIEADTILARVGAFFHDIGKLRHPKYFIENQVGQENVHDNLYAHSSAQIIKDHIKHGLELAEEYKLPLIIKDVIEQHHGDMFISFFYEKAKKEEPLEDVDTNHYKYCGPIPQFRESAIVMLADTVEAAVRSMADKLKCKADMEKFVNVLIKSKLDTGQLVDSELTIKELDIIQKSFMRVLSGMYHERIPYPKSTNKKGKQGI